MTPAPRPPARIGSVVRRGLAMLVGTAALVACRAEPERAGGAATQDPTSGTFAIDTLPSPAAPGSGEPSLMTTRDGRVHLTWLERQADSSHALRVAHLEGDRWSTPVTITRRADLFVNWADFPSLVESERGRLAAHWLQRTTAGKYSYEVRIAQSRDGGTTWTSGVVPHRDALPAEHGFVTMYAAAGDSIGLVWLDGRKTEMRDSTREMMLAHTTIAADGSLGAEEFVDRRICDCCQTGMARSSRGLVVAYRDRSPDEVRDIYVTRLENGAWTEPRAVHADGWEIDACPVNGPQVAARGDTVVVAWFTGARDTARVNVAFSIDGGDRFGAPIRVDDGAPAGRVDVELDDDGRAVVSWIERTSGDTAQVRLRVVGTDGWTSPPTVVATASAARPSGFPRIARAGNELVLAWTQPGTGGTPASVKLARARPADRAP